MIYASDSVSLELLEKRVAKQLRDQADALLAGSDNDTMNTVLAARGVARGLQIALQIARDIDAENRKKEERDFG